MPAGTRRDPQLGVAFEDLEGLPGLERVRVGEPALIELVGGPGSGDHGQRTVQVALSDLVEVVTVEVGQQDQVQRRQVGDVHGGIGEPGARQAVTEWHLLVAVHERRVGQHREAGVADEHGGVADEHQRTAALIGLCAFGQVKGQTHWSRVKPGDRACTRSAIFVLRPWAVNRKPRPHAYGYDTLKVLIEEVWTLLGEPLGSSWTS